MIGIFFWLRLRWLCCSSGGGQLLRLLAFLGLGSCAALVQFSLLDGFLTVPSSRSDRIHVLANVYLADADSTTTLAFLHITHVRFMPSILL
jgi:hypothetical protein